MIAAQLQIPYWPKSVVSASTRAVVSPIMLAHQPDFMLGALEVCPSARQVARAGWTDGLEPRVMQVLVALHQAHGGVVSRDDLINRCWDGRVVGDDAVNRAIGRLRKLSKTDHGASFVIETIPRVGYRLRRMPQITALTQRSGWRAAALSFFCRFLKG